MITINADTFGTLDSEYMFELTRSSPYVKSNIDYRKKSENTKYIVKGESDEFNAYAMTDGMGTNSITFLGGLLRSFKFMGWVLADYDNNQDVDKLKRSTKWLGEAVMGKFTESTIAEGLIENDINTTKKLELEAVSYWSGLIMFVMAHELGHICLSHTVRSTGDEQTSRNDERQADLFANSVVATTPFAKYNAIASLFVTILFTWLEGKDEGLSEPTTHPASRERVYNTLESNSATLAAYGITKETILDLLPKPSDFSDPIEDVYE
jgi:hypothetical protein